MCVFCAGYAFTMIEMNGIWKEYMEVEERGGSSRSVQVGEAAAGRSGGWRGEQQSWFGGSGTGR
jgi:hypothetical protein